MGGCVSKKNILNNTETIIRLNQNKPTSQPIREENFLLSKFEDMDEYEDLYSGEGIKRIKAYKCNLLINELQNLRNEFWMTHRENRSQWHIIQRACETDYMTAELILANSGLVCLEGNMKCIVDSNTGTVFNIPNFCINDPHFKKEFLVAETVPEKNLSITLINVFKNLQKYEVVISNKQSGGDLKNLFYQKENLCPDDYKLRLIYKGAEIKDLDMLSIYNFDSHPKIQVACNKIEKEEYQTKNTDVN